MKFQTAHVNKMITVYTAHVSSSGTHEHSRHRPICRHNENANTAPPFNHYHAAHGSRYHRRQKMPGRPKTFQDLKYFKTESLSLGDWFPTICLSSYAIICEATAKSSSRCHIQNYRNNTTSILYWSEAPYNYAYYLQPWQIRQSDDSFAKFYSSLNFISQLVQPGLIY
jgi:hypothetical protein